MKTLFSFPILLIFVLFFILIIIHFQRLRLAKMFIVSTMLFVYLMCTPLMTQTIFALIGRYPPLTISQLQTSQAQAIIVLGGGFYQGGEFSQPQAGTFSLPRVMYGAYLAKNSQLAVVVSGIEAQAMRNSLQMLDVEPKFVEDKSLDTHQNAQFSAQLLHPQGIKDIVLVTDAWHMSRSVLAFEHFGFKVLAAPTEFPEGAFITPPALFQPKLMIFMANLRGLAEVLGHVKYRIRYYFSN